MKICLPDVRIFFIFIICLMAISIYASPAKAGASPIWCSIYSNPTQPDRAGLNVCETEPATYCEEGFLCCESTYPTTISQDLFNDYRSDFIMDSFYTSTVEPNLQSVADEFRNATLMHLGAIGAFIDASIFNDTIKDMQVFTAQTLQSYTPSEQICRFGTLSKGLSASEAKMDTDRLVLSEVGIARNLGTQNSIAASGRGLDYDSRLFVFVEKFCSLQDNKSGLSELCDAANPITDLQHNRDIDYTRLMDNGVTINADLTDANRTQDETNVINLGHYLYGHRQASKRYTYTELNESEGAEGLYNEYRSVIARRAAAQNSYNTLASMKMAGSGGSESYIRRVMESIGISGGDLDRYLGAQNTDYPFVDTSYNEQMNLLTKQIYQTPEFYANLMDSKTNVKRTSAALQGMGLMQGRDTYKSMERSEMLTAILLELEARKIANNVTSAKTE
jgi:hypothetical protein